MNINSDIKNQVESFLSEEILISNSVSGGCIADSLILTTNKGNRYFLKTKSAAASMFYNEANGLKELQKANAIRIPEVYLAESNFLLLEYIEPGSKSSTFFKDFGKAFAQMHKFTAKEFGFYEDNYIGSNPQYNIANGSEKTDWAEFYFRKRLFPQFKMAVANGFVTEKLSKGIHILENHLPTILEGSQEAPTLVHGDLWGGNYLSDHTGRAVLIDPAAYYGHREADLAMTKMFGGFSSEFYTSYQQEFPLPDGWEYREGLYLLYHYLNHLNLFGRSYYNEVINLLSKYTL